MNLPHQKPIRFVNEIIKNSGDKLFISCTFPFYPSLAMACEAAAQSTIAFSLESENPKIGYLISLKDVELIKEMNFFEAIIEIEKSFSFGSMSEYSFELKNENISYAKGKITIAIENN